MDLVYSEHAKQRMRQRGITHLHVIHILQFPECTIKNTKQGVTTVIGTVQARRMRIIYTEQEKYLKIITII